jgi:uncharacterized protein YodC (DUF2158 family)
VSALIVDRGSINDRFKSGNLVVLKSGGPIMTVDAVHTDIFDDSKLTGVVCVWFLARNFSVYGSNRDAIEHARLQKTSSRKPKAHLEEATGEYKAALDEMVAAMNAPADTPCAVSTKVGKRLKSAKTGVKRMVTAPRPKHAAA